MATSFQTGTCSSTTCMRSAHGVMMTNPTDTAFVHFRTCRTPTRDLKLENLLLRREADGLLHAKLSDFGLLVVG